MSQSFDGWVNPEFINNREKTGDEEKHSGLRDSLYTRKIVVLNQLNLKTVWFCLQNKFSTIVLIKLRILHWSRCISNQFFSATLQYSVKSFWNSIHPALSSALSELPVSYKHVWLSLFACNDIFVILNMLKQGQYHIMCNLGFFHILFVPHE